jgi:hypothetical protein
MSGFTTLTPHSQLWLFRHGATVEQMTIEVNKAKDRLEKAEKDLKQMSKLNKVTSLYGAYVLVLSRIIYRH